VAYDSKPDCDAQRADERVIIAPGATGYDRRDGCRGFARLFFVRPAPWYATATRMLEVVATACAGLFAGAAVYISLVQHPTVVGVGGDLPARFFPGMYCRAAPPRAGRALVGTIAGVGAWALGSGAAAWGAECRRRRFVLVLPRHGVSG
jgi:hypothetical protein